MTKDVDQPTFSAAGDVLTYTITVENTGDQPLTEVDVIDPDLGGTIDCTPSAPASLDPASSIDCTGSYTVTQDDVNAGSFTNTATATGKDPDLNPVTDSDSATSLFSGGGGGATTADLSVTKTAPSPATVGSPLTYTIKVHNAGPSDATGVTMTDTLPSGVTFISASSTSGTCTQASGRVTCNIGSLATSSSVTITVKVTPNAVGAITNSASVTGTPTDPTSNNNTATVVTTVVAANHARSVTLKLRDSLRAVGRVTVNDGFSACADSVGVKAQRKVRGHWTTLRLMTTSSSGRYLMNLPDRHGKYRVLAPRVPAVDEICGKAVSPIRTHDDEEQIRPG